MSLEGLFYDWIKPEELEAAHKIELIAFPPDEAATLDAFKLRQSQAPTLFLGAYVPTRTLIGYVCATLSPASSLTHDSMAHHVPGAPSVCIHSVCVAPQYRRKRAGVQLLREYVARLASAAAYERALLITHADLRDFYEAAGFEWVGPSAVVHGALPWYEMRRDLGQVPDAPEPAMPPGLWDALNRPAGNRRTPSLFSALDLKDLAAEGSNKYDILCPREKCASIILKAGVGKLVERGSIKANYHKIWLKYLAELEI
ncbi:hypothetical protein HWV62_19415 [Athelia sp. TMB]|nr:hypothetical protein HWV62_19415 [Athelia sp. TMB]